MRKFIAIIFAILLLMPVAAERRKSTRRLPKASTSAKAAAAKPTVKYDTLCPAPEDVRLSGYDKPLSAQSETFFLTNNTTHNIHQLIFTIEYYDAQGRKLHQRQTRRKTRIPATETRKIDFPSWDRQQRFYYAGSRQPRVPGVPYTVKISVDTLLVDPVIINE